MGKKLYVGNLSYSTESSELQELFSEFGTVQSAEVISDRETGRSKGFGFVEMGSDDEAQAAHWRSVAASLPSPRALSRNAGEGEPALRCAQPRDFIEA